MRAIPARNTPSVSIALGPEQAAFTMALGLVEVLVKRFGAVVTEVDLDGPGTDGTIVLQVCAEAVTS